MSVETPSGPTRLSHPVPALSARAAVLAAGGLVIGLVVLAVPERLTVAVAAAAFLASLLLSLRADRRGPGAAVRGALAAPAGTEAEPVSTSVARAVLQGLLGVAVAAEVTILAGMVPWGAEAAAPGVLLALAVADLRAARVIAAGERRLERRLLGWPRILTGLLPVPGLARIRAGDLFLEPRPPVVAQLSPPPRRPPVWLIGSGTAPADGRPSGHVPSRDPGARG